MILAEIDGQGWVLVGSLNGGEVSAKLNREMCLLVASDEAYQYLADIFWYDWRAAMKRRRIFVVEQSHRCPSQLAISARTWLRLG